MAIQAQDSTKIEIVKKSCDRVLLKWSKQAFNYYQMKIICQDSEFIPIFTPCKCYTPLFKCKA